MTRLSKFIYEKSSVKVMIIAIVVFLVFTATVMPIVAQYTARVVGESSPDTSLMYSASDLYEMAEAYGEDGRRVYITLRFTFDLVWPLIYMFFMVTVLSRLLIKFPEKSLLRKLHFVPIIGGMFDFLENIAASIVLARYPLKTPLIAEMTPIVSLIKWGILGVGFMLIAVFIVVRIVMRKQS